MCVFIIQLLHAIIIIITLWLSMLVLENEIWGWDENDVFPSSPMIFVTPRVPFRGSDFRDPVNYGVVRDGGY